VLLLAALSPAPGILCRVRPGHSPTGSELLFNPVGVPFSPSEGAPPSLFGGRGDFPQSFFFCALTLKGIFPLMSFSPSCQWRCSSHPYFKYPPPPKSVSHWSPLPLRLSFLPLSYKRSAPPIGVHLSKSSFLFCTRF